MRRSYMIALLSVLLLMSSAVVQGKAVSLTPEQQEMASEIEYLLRCPVCEGQAVAESNAEVAQQIKEKVREMIAEGKSKDEILGYYVDRYGDWIISKPPARGAGLVAWLLPVAVVVIGLGVLIGVFRRGKGTVAGGSSVVGGSTSQGFGKAGLNDDQINEKLKDYV